MVGKAQKTHWFGCWETAHHEECAREEVRRLRDMLFSITVMAATQDGELNSRGNNVYAEAIRLLAGFGLVDILMDKGDYVVATATE